MSLIISKMGKAGYVVFGCIHSKENSRHCFPNAQKIDNTLETLWISAVRNTKLFEMSEEYVYSHFRIYIKHFLQEDIETNKTLKKTDCSKSFLPEHVIDITTVPLRNDCIPVEHTYVFVILPQEFPEKVIMQDESVPGPGYVHTNETPYYPLELYKQAFHIFSKIKNKQ